jgi:hypothetical protein
MREPVQAVDSQPPRPWKGTGDSPRVFSIRTRLDFRGEYVSANAETLYVRFFRPAAYLDRIFYHLESCCLALGSPAVILS